MEWLRTIPFATQTRNVAYAYAEGGLQATDADGVTETSAFRAATYTVVAVDLRISVGFLPEIGTKTQQPSRGSRFQLLRSSEAPSIP